VRHKPARKRCKIIPSVYCAEVLERRVLLSAALSDIFAVAGPVAEYASNGTTINSSLISGLNGISSMAVSAPDLFIAEQGNGTIGEYTTSGTTVNASLLSGFASPSAIAVSGTLLFIADNSADTIGEYTTSGATVNASLVTGLDSPTSLVCVGGDLFVLNSGDGTVGEYSTSGATINASLIPALSGTGPTTETQALVMVASGSDLFVLQKIAPDYNLITEMVSEYATSGAVIDASLISGLTGAQSMAASGSDLFFTTEDYTDQSFFIGEYDTTGALVNAAIASGFYGFGPICAELVGPTSQLAFAQQPSHATAGNPIGSTITVDLEDASNNLVLDDDSDVSLSIASGPDGASLGGTLTMAAVNGVATFTDVVPETAGNYVLQASDGAVTCNSVEFGVDPPGLLFALGNSEIGEYTTAGGTVNGALVSGLGNPTSIANSAQNLFVLNNDSGTIGEYTITGATVNASLITGLGPLAPFDEQDFALPASPVAQPAGNVTFNSTLLGVIAAATPYLYVGEYNGIFTNDSIAEYNTSGELLNDITLPTSSAIDIAATGTHLFVLDSSSGTISEYKANGKLVNASLIAGLDGPSAIAISGSDLFVANDGNGSIGEYTTSGAPVNPSLITGLGSGFGMNIFGSEIFVLGGSAGGEYSTSGTLLDDSIPNESAFADGVLIAPQAVGPATQIAFGQAPVGGFVSTAITPAITVELEDSNGNLVMSDNSVVTLTILNTTTGTVAGTLTATAFNGVATFSDVSIGTGATYTLSASDPGDSVPAVTSNPFVISAPTELAFTSAIGAGSTDYDLGQINVSIEDQNGNVMGNEDSEITLSIGSGPAGGQLSGTLSLNATEGTAQFDDISVNLPGTYTLTATDSSDGLTVNSNPFAVVPLVPTQLSFFQQPSNMQAGTKFNLFVDVDDANGDEVYTNSGSNIELSIQSGPTGAVLYGNTTVLSDDGGATFSTLTLYISGTYRLLTTDGTLTLKSAKFTVGPAPSAKIAFLQEPSGAVVNDLIVPAIVIGVEDSYGNLETSDDSKIKVAIQSGPAGATLSGKAKAFAVNGTASFQSLSVNKVGKYKLVATDGIFTAHSAKFAIVANPESSPDFTTPATSTNSYLSLADLLVDSGDGV
jgi:hypothetical protein